MLLGNPLCSARTTIHEDKAEPEALLKMHIPYRITGTPKSISNQAKFRRLSGDEGNIQCSNLFSDPEMEGSFQ
ncbi:hypothetical protein [Paracoccus sp. 228]|uniref:hypothetical protein n=1 Tax=Paracoccus sp. 228 TaxID=1192054 RepID=UPI0012ED4827|nr:hypothetical protein [Paracoccus sp. 228]